MGDVDIEIKGKECWYTSTIKTQTETRLWDVENSMMPYHSPVKKYM